MSCPFCNMDSLRDRIFYENDSWFAFLAAPFHTKGHTILAIRPTRSICPRVDRQGWGGLHCFDVSLGIVATSLIKHYNPKDILFSSVRGDIAHFHCHLIPLWQLEEERWREEHNYPKGHLLEYLGYLEKQGDERAKSERKNKALKADEHRRQISETLKPDVEALRKITGYSETQEKKKIDD